MSKGADTRERIVDRAVRLASRDGLGGLTIGNLAEELGLSKSGLFAHFGSKEELQIAVLQAASVQFEDCVLRPAFKAPRGLPRIKQAFERWLQWVTHPSMPGGCLFVAAAAELDDREGRPRDFLVGTQRKLLGALAKAARLAVEEGHFRRDLDVEQFAFELYAIVLGYNHARRLLRDGHADTRARHAFRRLIDASLTRDS
jgi:AcrR family transcriptional regulator